MNKIYDKKTFLSFDEKQIINKLYFWGLRLDKDEANAKEQLALYHQYLQGTTKDRLKRLNLEFDKIKSNPRQVQLYLMLLERFKNESLKEYDFLSYNTDRRNPTQPKLPIFVILDQVRSAHNIGAILRACECFGVQKIYLITPSPTPEHSQVKKTAMGCHELVEWEEVEDAHELFKTLKNEGVKIIAFETTTISKPLREFEFKKDGTYALVFGHEQYGVTPSLLDESDNLIELKLRGSKNSLNVSQSVCCALWYAQGFWN